MARTRPGFATASGKGVAGNATSQAGKGLRHTEMARTGAVFATPSAKVLQETRRATWAKGLRDTEKARTHPVFATASDKGVAGNAMCQAGKGLRDTGVARMEPVYATAEGKGVAGNATSQAGKALCDTGMARTGNARCQAGEELRDTEMARTGPVLARASGKGVAVNGSSTSKRASREQESGGNPTWEREWERCCGEPVHTQAGVRAGREDVQETRGARRAKRSVIRSEVVAVRVRVGSEDVQGTRGPGRAKDSAKKTRGRSGTPSRMSGQRHKPRTQSRRGPAECVTECAMPQLGPPGESVSNGVPDVRDEKTRRWMECQGAELKATCRGPPGESVSNGVPDVRDEKTRRWMECQGAGMGDPETQALQGKHLKRHGVTTSMPRMHGNAERLTVRNASKRGARSAPEWRAKARDAVDLLETSTSDDRDKLAGSHSVHWVTTVQLGVIGLETPLSRRPLLEAVRKGASNFKLCQRRWGVSRLSTTSSRAKRIRLRSPARFEDNPVLSRSNFGW
ncbi:hypothetical protein BC826DRAFT_974511 [Russula brevipes]|nr:hypothetical protein BC826DRAFT_974511 [Russula brevipes]